MSMPAVNMFDTTKYFVGAPVSQLSESEQTILHSFLQQQANGHVAAVYVQPTHRVGAQDVPEGVNVVFRRDAPLPRGLFSPSFFKQLSITKIVPADEQQSHFAEDVLAAATNKIGAAVSNTPEEETYDLHTHIYDPDKVHGTEHSGPEPKPWREWLDPSSGHFVGVYRHDIEASEPEYYVAVCSGSGRAGRSLLEFANEQASLPQPMTIGAFMNTPAYIQVRDAAQRNNERIAARVARACGGKIVHYDDVFAHCEPNMAPPTRARTNVHMVSNTLSAMPDNSGNTQLYVGYYSRCAPVSPIDDHVALPLDPISGIRVFSASRATLPPQSDVRRLGMPFGLEQADPVYHAAHIRSLRERLDQHDGTRRYVGERVTWSGRSAQSHDNHRLWSYAPYGTHHEQMLRDMLGDAAVHGQVHLKPVRVWIAADSQ
jgi:hypothetical protein